MTTPQRVDVERFTVDCEPCNDFESWRGVMRGDVHGFYVRHSDYAALLQQLDENEARIEAYARNEEAKAIDLRECGHVRGQLRKRAEDSESKLAERDAEIARVTEIARRNHDGFEEYERRYYLENDRAEAAESKLAERDAEIAGLRAKVWSLERGHETAVETIKTRGQFVDALANDLRAAGCAVDFDASPVVTNPRAEAAERAREVAVRAVNWYADNQSMVTECNGKWFAVVGNRDEVAQCDNGLDAIVAAFLAANGGG